MSRGWVPTPSQISNPRKDMGPELPLAPRHVKRSVCIWNTFLFCLISYCTFRGGPRAVGVEVGEGGRSARFTYGHLIKGNPYNTHLRLNEWWNSSRKIEHFTINTSTHQYIAVLSTFSETRKIFNIGINANFIQRVTFQNCKLHWSR